MRLKYLNKNSHKPRRIFTSRTLILSFILIFTFISFIHFYPRIYNVIISNNLNLVKYFSNITGFELKEIHVTGRENLNSKKLIQLIGLEKGKSLFAINIKTIQQKLLNEGWIKNVSVERRLPNIIHINIEEHLPFAILQINNENILVASDGTKITSDGIGKFSHLPVIMGNDAEKHAFKILEILISEPNLFHHVWAISYIGKRRWDIHLISGIKIKLPEKEPAAAWSKLAEIDRKNSIISRNILSIDLRVKDNFIIEPVENPIDKNHST